MKAEASVSNDHDSDNRSFRLGLRVVTGTALAFLLVAGAGGWAATAQLSGAIIAPGTVKVDDNLKSIQHRDGGIISEIAVKEGDLVEKGQVLLRLDDAQTRAELTIVSTQLSELKARQARLVAERDNLDWVSFPTVLVERQPGFEDVAAGEMRLFRGNQKHRRSQSDQLELGIRQLGEEVKGLEAQLKSKADEIALVVKEAEKIRGLADKRLIEGARIYNSDRDIARLAGERAEIEAGIARAGARMSEIKLQIIAVDETARTEAQRELSQVEPKISELNERRAAIEDVLSRTDIRAPIAGTVNELSVHTIGGVITPAEKLVTLVPAEAKLKIEARLSPTDIDQISIGRPAKLRFSAFNQRTTPELQGAIAYVSPATSTDPANGQVYYIANVTVAAAEMAKLEDNRLLPGMPVEIYISTDERTAMSYLVKPLSDQFNRAFREQ